MRISSITSFSNSKLIRNLSNQYGCYAFFLCIVAVATRDNAWIFKSLFSSAKDSSYSLSSYSSNSTDSIFDERVPSKRKVVSSDRLKDCELGYSDMDADWGHFYDTDPNLYLNKVKDNS
tara:strand:- start:320 stop:676 length:357 start_codon:yes stop_codon:yes gene_type:complete